MVVSRGFQGRPPPEPEPEYEYVPPQLEGKYQSFTEADLAQLRATGYPGDFMTVEQGVAAYVSALGGK